MIRTVELLFRMKQVPGTKPVERLFPFVLRSRNLIVGRESLLRSKSKLHFVLITTDLSENSRDEILAEFAHYPVVQHYQTHDLKSHFGLEGTKVVGFAKSGLAQSLYAELKQYRVNKPGTSPGSAGVSPASEIPTPSASVAQASSPASSGGVSPQVHRQIAGGTPAELAAGGACARRSKLVTDWRSDSHLCKRMGTVLSQQSLS
jgi:hypothetical protein